VTTGEAISLQDVGVHTPTPTLRLQDSSVSLINWSLEVLDIEIVSSFWMYLKKAKDISKNAPNQIQGMQPRLAY